MGGCDEDLENSLMSLHETALKSARCHWGLRAEIFLNNQATLAFMENSTAQLTR